MLAGMGMVFVFLTLLVFATRFMSYLVNQFFPEPEVSESATRLKPAVSQGQQVDPTTLKVIQEAIHLHRAKVG